MTTSNIQNKESSLSPWLQSFGFTQNPFSMLYAENQSDDMLQETYYVADEADKLIQLMLDEERPVAFLAPYGGGKTAACLYTKFRWQQEKPHAFITVYNNFTVVAEQLPHVTLNTHRAALVEAVADSFWTYIKKAPDKLLSLPEHWQVWWWSLLENHLSGEPLYFRVNGASRLIPSYQRYKRRIDSGQEISPFRPEEQLPNILKTISGQLAKIDFTRWLILVDEIDGETNHKIDDLNYLLSPILNTQFLFRMSITWKFFIPEEIKDAVYGSSAFRGSGLRIANIKWGKNELIKLLSNRLRWASNDSFKSMASLSIEVPDLDEKLANLASNHQETFGAPRALLRLGEEFVSQLTPGSLITRKDWEQFENWNQFVEMTVAHLAPEITGIMQPQERQEVAKSKILETLTSDFDLAELKELAFHLKIDFEELPGEIKSEKARELINHCDRRHKIPQLLQLICEKRPQSVVCQDALN